MRRGAIELRKSIGKNNRFELVQCSDNPLFGKESEFQIITERGYRKRSLEDNFSYNPKIFSLKEESNLIAEIENGIIEYNGNNYDKLTYSELLDFNFLLRAGIKKSMRWKI